MAGQTVVILGGGVGGLVTAKTLFEKDWFRRWF